ncbi:MAG: cytochrome P450 [Chloroflexi bacterium OLB14]|nr:MAG: cytochrome P450 [Chloroflexi bacterium OLB14]
MTLPTYHLNINDPEFIAKPYAQLKTLRQEMPVYRDEVWNKVFFNLYSDVASLLKDKRLGRTMLHRYSREEIGWPPPDPKLAGFRSYQDNVFMDMEGESHSRIRSLVTKVFTPKRVESLRAKLESTTHKLIDAVEKNGACNFVSDIAEPLPVIMIADLLGIPEEHRAMLRPWSAAIVKMYELGYSDEQINEANKAAVDFMNLIGELANERRKNPQDDLITDLVQVESAGEKLTENEMRATAIFLLNAGHEATVNGSALGLMSLFQNQNQFEIMKEAVHQNNQALIKTAVDEMLRYETPLPMFERYVLEDMEINGVQLKRGDEVALMYISGNHDEKRFTQPDELVLSRQDNPLLTFGLGTHYCLGAPLARLELQVLFSVLIKRLPNLESNGDAVFSKGFVIRGLESLPIKF